ncbi:hypothetical protein EV356DRAFT_510063 [Viridothelium virens]|uniref:Uncharacterized protein n=1 Tax=Viridothelium virens TaxID=1048519 RepID=A0A6A6GVR7_VIRVR|nr:hypothetical protein EV356DRAFT_510063 [Viridothelium virens]
MSSYRAPGGDSFRPGPPRARRDSDRDFDREYYRSRSPPLRRRSPPSGEYGRPKKQP